jgi:group I intron endonuclease
MSIKQKCQGVPSKSGIYKLVNPNGKIYVGQTTNFNSRLKSYYNNCEHIKEQRKLYYSFKKYGVENHKFIILEYCNISDLDKREYYWGNRLDVLGINGLVCRLGHGKGKLSNETKKLISMALKGKKQSFETIEKRRQKLIGREVSQAERDNKRQGKLDFYKNNPLNWKDKISESKQNSSYVFTDHHKSLISNSNKKPILQYDLSGNFIKEFSSSIDAMEETGIKNDNISHCLRNKSKSAGGFIWRYKENKNLIL